MEARGPRSYSNPQSHSGSFVARCILQIAVSFLSRIGPSFASSHAASPAAVFSSKSAVALSAGGSCKSANASQYRKAAFLVSGGSFDWAPAVSVAKSSATPTTPLFSCASIFSSPEGLFFRKHTQRAVAASKIGKHSPRSCGQLRINLLGVLQRQSRERQQCQWACRRFRFQGAR